MAEVQNGGVFMPGFGDKKPKAKILLDIKLGDNLEII